MEFRKCRLLIGYRSSYRGVSAYQNCWPTLIYIKTNLVLFRIYIDRTSYDSMSIMDNQIFAVLCVCLVNVHSRPTESEVYMCIKLPF